MVAEVLGDPLGHLRGRARTGGSPAAGRRGRRWGCAPRRGAAGARRCAAGHGARAPASGTTSCADCRKPGWVLGTRPGTARQRPGRAGQGRDDPVDGGVVVRRRRRTTPRTRSAAGRRPASSIAWKNAAERRRCPGRARRRSCAPAPSRKKTENIVPAHWTRCGTPASDKASDAASAMARDDLAEAGVEGVVAGPQRGQAGGGGDRVPGQRAGLVDRARRARAAP